MSETEAIPREERLRELQSEIAAISSEAAEEAGNVADATVEVAQEAEETVAEVAEELQEEVAESHETISEAEREVEEAVEEAAHDAAEEAGHPEQWEAFAEYLFRRMEERGLLPHTQNHHVSPVAETEQVAEVPVEAAAEAPAEVAHVAEEVAPEPQHWYYREPRFLRFRKR